MNRPHLYDVVPKDLYSQMLEAKYIKEQTHPTQPLIIANYTDACMWDQAWNEATMQCRGLIRTADTHHIVARPFGKFFNYEQEQAPRWTLDTKVHVTDKMDGSLGILYRQPDGQYAVATRGSFASDQAIWATNWLQEFIEREKFTPSDSITYLFEIIYPENRVVIDYGNFNLLVLLGGIDIATGQSISAEHIHWPGFKVHTFYQEAPLKQILELPPRKNAEGFVLWNPETDERVKIKYEEYKALHRYLTNTTEKHVWEVLSAGQDPAEIFAAAPDEFHEWLRQVVAELTTEFERKSKESMSAYSDILAQLPDDYTRKEFALVASQHPYRANLFRIYDGRPDDDIVWKELKPHGTRTFRKVSSDSD